MQYKDPTDEDLNVPQYLALRARRAQNDRPQTHFSIKQATFDNFGLARPRTINEDLDPYADWLRSR